ncbi:MAG: hypothetical protein ACOC6B_02565 [Thermodesulfobacteriota bacterium]
MGRSFTVVCPFCDDFYPFPEHIEEVYRCRRCGAVFTIAWRSEMEEAVNQLATSFIQDDSDSKQTPGDDSLYQAVVYEDIENILRMKRDYETHTLFRSFQGFDQDYLEKLVLVWLGNKGQIPYLIDSCLR